MTTLVKAEKIKCFLPQEEPVIVMVVAESLQSQIYQCFSGLPSLFIFPFTDQLSHLVSQPLFHCRRQGPTKYSDMIRSAETSFLSLCKYLAEKINAH